MKPLRFLATGDLQIHKWIQFAYTNKRGMNSRLANCLRVLSFLRKTALERKIDKLLLNGDILEECDYIDVEVFDGLYTGLERIKGEGIETVINLGNHDVHSKFGGRILHALRALRGVARIVEEPTLVWDRVQVVPWIHSVAKFKSTIRNLEPDRHNVLALHCGVQGATTGPQSYLVRNPIKLADIRYKEFGLVLLSDYHTRQRLAKTPPVWYLGSPLQHSFGEIHRPCIWEVSVDAGSQHFQLDKIYTSFPRFRRVRAKTYDGLLRRSVGYASDYVQVVCESDTLSDDDVRRAARKIGYQVDIKRVGEEKQGDIQDSKSLSFKTAMKRYVSSNVKSEVTGEKLLRIGWKIFNGEI